MNIRRIFGASLRAAGIAACIGLLFAQPARAQVRGLSYTISPLVEQIYFDRNAALDDGTLYGGQLGLGFGRFIELEGLYLLNDRFSNDFSEIAGITEETRAKLEALDPRDISLRRYGGKIKINVPTSNVLPFVTAGAGVLSFQPEDLNETRTIYLALGAGVQFSVAGRYALTLAAERFGYRYNLGATFFDDLDLARADLSDASFNHTQVNNWALRAGVRIYVGGRAPGEETPLDRALREQFSGGLRGISLRVEPFAGQLNFDEDLGFKPEQRMAGVFAGLNLGPFIGARGFYWRGIESGVLDFDHLQAFGGELRFELTSGQSLSPYLMVGGGYLDVLEGYAAPATIPGDDVDPEFVALEQPEDEPFIIVGAGAVLPLNESLSLNAGARSILLTREGADNVNGPSDVVSSWMFTVGVNFGFGARRDRAGEAIRSEIAGRQADDRSDDDDVRQELALAEARIDSLAALIVRIAEGDSEALSEARDLSLAGDADSLAAETARARLQTRRYEDRMVTLPLPERGELYIRFGDPGGVTIESAVGDAVLSGAGAGAGAGEFASEFPTIRQSLTAEQIEQIVSQTVREQLRATEAQAATEADLSSIERRIEDRLDALENRLQARLDRRLSDLENAAVPRTLIIDDTRAGDTASRLRVDLRPEPQRSAYPFVAYMSGEADLGIIGLRLHPGSPLFGPIELQPEIGFGIGADTYAYHLNLDAVYTASFFERVLFGLRPYVAAGAGMLGFNEKPEDVPGVQFTVNARIGSELRIPWGGFFLEYGTYDFFDYHRFAAGYRVRL